MSQLKPGARFSKALASESPLQIVGTINANHALMAKRRVIKQYIYQAVAWLLVH